MLIVFERELANFHLAFEIKLQIRVAGDSDLTLCRKTAFAGDGEDGVPPEVDPLLMRVLGLGSVLRVSVELASRLDDR